MNFFTLNFCCLPTSLFRRHNLQDTAARSRLQPIMDCQTTDTGTRSTTSPWRKYHRDCLKSDPFAPLPFARQQRIGSSESAQRPRIFSFSTRQSRNYSRAASQTSFPIDSTWIVYSTSTGTIYSILLYFGIFQCHFLRPLTRVFDCQASVNVDLFSSKRSRT
ncbi:hypothetical protein C8J56DRAFT_920906 [Mycena floridula]|nr:hypothetical protein C8J56DRAFT_920906 [Mycena floridula]